MSTTAPPPARSCDLVMKGGITSGVVYPHAVVELSREYRFKSIGGTSAGAIAAAASAAAEYGRTSAGGGFARLAELPGWIGRDGNLTALFQPQQATRRLFALLLAPILHPHRRVRALLGATLRGYWPAVLIGAAPGIALAVSIALAGDGAALIAIGLVAAVLLAGGGASAVLAGWLARSATRAVTANGYGLCSGMPGAGRAARRPALTPWLADLIDATAGRPVGDDAPPLTFGDLWDGPAGAPDAGGAGPWLRLEMITTNVTNRRAERLPWASREFFFDPQELRRLFPERVVRWMEDHPPELPSAPERARRRRLGLLLMGPRLRPMPDPRDLPVVVATRMSLSFPVLLSAVPLWRVDQSRTANQRANAAWRSWAREQAAAGAWERVADAVQGGGAWPADAPRERPQAEQVWFSDGGVASNFPIHFFDASVPRRPTFGINLRPLHPDLREEVTLAGRPGDGLLDWFYELERRPSRLGFDSRLAQFLGGIVRTMQNRVDEAQMRVPGYRERIVHVGMSADEGGMNLAMDDDTIEALTNRGRRAAERLVEAYAVPPAEDGGVTWDLHRWIRYRSTLAATVDLLEAIDAGLRGAPEGGERTYAQLLAEAGAVAPRSYAPTAGQRALAGELNEWIAQLVARVEASGVSLADDAPRPAPAARIVPQDLPADGG